MDPSPSRRPHAGPTLVVLAAGMGSRYGGMKQLAEVGPSGETLMDYSIFDARRAGFDSVVFVIRPEMEATFRSFASGRYGRFLPCQTVHQRLDDLPVRGIVPGRRAKPWGTGQAVLAAAGAVVRSFTVVNADDFYGAGAFEAMAGFLSELDERASPPRFGLTGYRLAETLSESGGVNRGVLGISEDGLLTSIEEVTDIRRAPGGLEGMAGTGRRVIPDDALVSMNMWGFTPAVFPILTDGFRRFLTSADSLTAEYLLPTVIQEAVAAGTAQVEVLDPGSSWFGITYPDDVPAVTIALRTLVREGRYPTALFG